MAESELKRKIYIMRHAERVDFTFGDWIPKCFDDDGNYIRTDLNMPISVPPRKGGPSDFFKDCPLTNIGCYQATLTGEALKEKGVKFSHVYCSPSLRCIQTCSNVLKASDQADLPINVEPGLFEWLSWYAQGMPVWLTNEELRSLGYNISSGYVPIVSKDTLTKTSESILDYYMRSFFVSRDLFEKTKDGNLFFVGHAATLDTCSRQLVGREPREIEKFMSVIYRTPYASIVTIEQNGDSWNLAPPPIPSGSVMHSNNISFNWEILNS